MVKETKQRKAAFAFPRCLRLRALTDQAVSSSSRRRRPPRPLHGRKERPASRPADWRDWAALPGTALRAILGRLHQTDVLRGTGPGLACTSWRRAAVEDPLLWRRIDLASDEDGDKDAPAGWNWKAMARAAVDRSAGRCESFRGRVDGDFLVYLADRAPLLRSLRVTSSFDMDHSKLGASAMEKLPLLERLVVARGFFDKRMLCAVLDHCPRLRLLDAGGCRTFSATGKRLVARCQSRIRHLRLPRRLPGGYYCCRKRAPKYADEHDE